MPFIKPTRVAKSLYLSLYTPPVLPDTTPGGTFRSLRPILEASTGRCLFLLNGAVYDCHELLSSSWNLDNTCEHPEPSPDGFMTSAVAALPPNVARVLADYLTSVPLEADDMPIIDKLAARFVSSGWIIAKSGEATRFIREFYAANVVGESQQDSDAGPLDEVTIPRVMPRYQIKKGTADTLLRRQIMLSKIVRKTKEGDSGPKRRYSWPWKSMEVNDEVAIPAEASAAAVRAAHAYGRVMKRTFSTFRPHGPSGGVRVTRVA